ncbi:hypothetical protein BTH41_04010 [Bacillus mycoides]|nr:hypothetical protein BTH41_04010 [Bacillus mycoides]
MSVGHLSFFIMVNYILKNQNVNKKTKIKPKRMYHLRFG